jgi:hypothetical protein
MTAAPMNAGSTNVCGARWTMLEKVCVRIKAGSYLIGLEKM